MPDTDDAEASGVKSTTQASCDRCRQRKVKCTQLSEDELVEARAAGAGNRCKGCNRADKECTHTYVHKKPGRPLGSGGNARRRTTSRSASARRSASPHHQRPISPSAITNSLGAPLGLTDLQLDGSSGPASGSIFGSARNALSYAPAYHPPRTQANFVDLGLDHSLDGVLGRTQSHDHPAPSLFITPNAFHSAPGSTNNTPGGRLDLLADVGARYEQGTSLDAVLDWSDVCWFIALYLRNHHCLGPLVHKPTFTQDMVNRRDKDDEAFRGLLCSMVAYTICQSPISTMTGAYERPRLADILHRCTKAADAIRNRLRLNPSIVLLAGTLLDWVTAQAWGNTQAADLLVAETTRLTHALGLNEANPRAATNPVERELCRRLFWVIYSKDKTDALSGRPIILHDFEGVPPLPLEVDDDYITTAGNLPQPPDRTSYMVGFRVIMRIFQVISQCISRHRAFANRLTDADAIDAGAGDDGDDAHHLRWITGAWDRVHAILHGLPPNLCMDLQVRTRAELDDIFGDFSLFRTQQSNITITALCAEFALLDFRASLRPDEDTRAEREEVARKAYDTLSSIPIEHLAYNGESMRGKVLRIILALLHNTTEPVNFSQSIWDWWNMYSRVQFLQVIPDETTILMDQAGSASTDAALASA